MKLFDLHCDTVTKLYYDAIPFTSDSLHLSFSDTMLWETHTQVFACFCRPALSDDAAFYSFFAMRRHLLDVLRHYHTDCLIPILAVEDARLLGNSRARLPMLYRAGVRILTLLWRGESVIGGAFDTDIGLSPFGKDILSDCLQLGIIPDVSHASERAFYDILEGCGSHSPLASHSNSRSIQNHPRNLTDAQFSDLLRAKGLCGLSLCAEHLANGQATSDDLLLHIEHFLSLGGEDHIALGTDFDGIQKTPSDIKRNRDLLTLADKMVRVGYSDALIHKVFWKNANDFFGKYKRQEAL